MLLEVPVDKPAGRERASIRGNIGGYGSVRKQAGEPGTAEFWVNKRVVEVDRRVRRSGLATERVMCFTELARFRFGCAVQHEL